MFVSGIEGTPMTGAVPVSGLVTFEVRTTAGRSDIGAEYLKRACKF